MKALLVYLCFIAISVSRSAPVNDALSKSDEKRDPGWSVGVEFGKRGMAVPAAENDVPIPGEKRGWGGGVSFGGKRGLALPAPEKDTPSESAQKRGWGASVHFGKRGVAFPPMWNDAPNTQADKRGWGASVHFGKRSLPFGSLPVPDFPPFQPQNPGIVPIFDHPKNDPSAHWDWKDTVSALGIAKDLIGKRDEFFKQGGDGGDGNENFNKWLQLAKDVIGLFQHNSANSQEIPDSTGQ